jgi:hypothetical protein
MKERILNRFLIVIILGIIAAKFIHIEADPWSIKSTADIHDEAWWAENAKLKIQENIWMKDGIAGGLAVSPVINLIYYCSFKLLGINFFSLRIFSVIASILNIMLYYVLAKKFLLSSKEVLLSTLVFASLPTYFILGRTGLLESGIITFLLLSIILVLQKNTWCYVLSGIVAAIGLQFKGSFILLIPIVVYLVIAYKRKSILYDLLRFFLGFVSVTVLFYLFYYYPNYTKFSPYYTLFNAEFYSLKELFHPAGIVVRLGYLFSKETLADPFIFLIVTLFIIKITFQKFNDNLYKLMLAFVVGLGFILFSDFNDKRILMLCIGFPIFITSNTSQTPVLNIKILRAVAIFCAFSLFSYMPKVYLFNWNEPELVGFSINSVILFVLLLIVASVVLFHLESEKKLSFISYFSYLILIAFFLAKILSKIIQNQFQLDFKSDHSILIAAILICIICYLIIRIRNSWNYLIPLIICVQISYISFQLHKDTFEIRKLNLLFTKIGKENERIIGPNTIFEIAFLSKIHPIYFSSKGLIVDRISTDKIAWFGAITTSEYSEKNLQSDLNAIEKNLKKQFKPYYSVKIYKNKYKALLFRSLN